MNQTTNRLKIIFAGTPEFAATTLSKLLESEHEVCAVYTQPDRPAGRGRKLTPSPVKQLATQHDLPVYQPDSLKDPAAQQQLAALEADIMVVVAYGLILPQVVLDTPRHGCLNIHASLLPRWRGAAPIQRAIEAGDNESGVTIMQMNAGLDTGDMLYKSSCPIEPNDTAQTLHDRLAEMGANTLLAVLQQVLSNTLQPEPQNEALANYAAKMEKQEAEINWQESAQEIAHRIRAFNPWPVCFTQLHGKPFRILMAYPLGANNNASPGTVIKADQEGIDVACGTGVLRLSDVQMAGKKATSASEFIRGHALQGTMFGQQACR